MRNDRRPALLLLSGRMLPGRSSATRRARCAHMLRRTAGTVHAERHPPDGLPTTVSRFRRCAARGGSEASVVERTILCRFVNHRWLEVREAKWALIIQN